MCWVVFVYCLAPVGVQFCRAQLAAWQACLWATDAAGSRSFRIISVSTIVNMLHRMFQRLQPPSSGRRRQSAAAGSSAAQAAAAAAMAAGAAPPAEAGKRTRVQVDHPALALQLWRRLHRQRQRAAPAAEALALSCRCCQAL